MTEANLQARASPDHGLEDDIVESLTPRQTAAPRPDSLAYDYALSRERVSLSSERRRGLTEAAPGQPETQFATPRATPVPQLEPDFAAEDLAAALDSQRGGRRTAGRGGVTVGLEPDTCRIAVWHGYVKTQFYATRAGATMQQALQSSPMFRAPGGSEPQRTEEAEDALAYLIAALEQDGWTVLDDGQFWFERTLERRHSAR